MFNSIVADVFNILFLAAAIVSIVIVFKIGRIGDDGDEMAEYNYTKAKATAGSMLHMLLCVLSMATAIFFGLLQDMDISWPRIISRMFFILMGIHNLMIGLVFRKLEAE